MATTSNDSVWLNVYSCAVSLLAYGVTRTQNIVVHGSITPHWWPVCNGGSTESPPPPPPPPPPGKNYTRTKKTAWGQTANDGFNDNTFGSNQSLTDMLLSSTPNNTNSSYRMDYAHINTRILFTSWCSGGVLPYIRTWVLDILNDRCQSEYLRWCAEEIISLIRV